MRLAKVGARIQSEDNFMSKDMRILPLTYEHFDAVKRMMRVFYASPAVSTDGSEEIFSADLAECAGDSPYAEGYVFEEDGALIGYAMLAKSFSTEFGKPCVWIEDIYLIPERRGLGYAGAFFSFVDEKYDGWLKRLELEPDNASALVAYKKAGFSALPYLELKK